MSDPPTTCLTVIANPDVSGIGVRTAIYAQNLLSFVPVLWALKDGRITPTELDELEKQSTTILITAFAILISTVIQAYHHGISNYHASIVLDLSWMNNTNLFIYFLLYVYHRVHLSEDEFNEEVGLSPGRARYRADSLSRWIYEANKAFKNSVIIIGSLHLSLMAAVGIWLWSHPAGFGNSGLCSLSATISVFGNQIQLGSRTLRKWSLLVYSTVSVPLLNLFIPMIFFALPFLILKHIIRLSGNVMFYSTIVGLWTLAVIDIILLVDTEVAIKNNTNYFRLSGEAQWTFGQTLALLLLLVALRDLGESILHKRSKWLSDQLLKASKNGEIESVKSLLRQGANPQDACVWIALVNNHLAIASFVINHTDLKTKDFQRDGNQNMVKVLQEYEGDKKSKDGYHKPFLIFAVQKGYFDIVQTLLKYKANVNSKDSNNMSALHHAAKHGYLNIVKILLEYQADVTLKDTFSMSALHYAAENGTLNVISLLLQYQADVHLKDSMERSALHYAARNGHSDCVRNLLQHEANVNLTDISRKSPLHYAVEYGHLNVTEVLLEHQADVHSYSGIFPLHDAARNGHLDITKILIQHQADVNVIGSFNQSPLHNAAQSGHLNIVKVLLDHQANVHLTDHRGMSPLHFAVKTGHLDITRTLLQHQADINLTDLSSMSALHYAAKYSHLNIVEVLLEHEANVHLIDSFGKSALDYATQENQLDIIKLLQDTNHT